MLVRRLTVGALKAQRSMSTYVLSKPTSVGFVWGEASSGALGPGVEGDINTPTFQDFGVKFVQVGPRPVPTSALPLICFFGGSLECRSRLVAPRPMALIKKGICIPGEHANTTPWASALKQLAPLPSQQKLMS